MARQPGPIKRLWYEWKMMRLPWRKKWLVGFDLEGNTFWEFKDALQAHRLRRIVHYSRSTHLSEVNVRPQWIQWLRHTRLDPPSLAEQQADLLRQERMKLLAAAADARWAAKPSVLDAPDKGQPIQMLESRELNQPLTQTSGEQHRIVQGEHVRPLEEPGEVESTATRPGTVEGEKQKETLSQVDEVPTLKTRKPMKKEPRDSPWKKQAQGNPGDDWQPQSWAPGPSRRRT